MFSSPLFTLGIFYFT